MMTTETNVNWEVVDNCEDGDDNRNTVMPVMAMT